MHALPPLRNSLVPGLLIVLGLWLGHPNDILSCPPLVLLLPLGVVLMGHGATDAKAAFFRTLAWGTGGCAAALYWLVNPLSEVGGLPTPACVPLMLGVALAYASEFAFLAALAQRFWQADDLASSLLFGLGWYIVDTSYAWAFGFPWLTLPAALAPWPSLVQTSSILGATLVGALWVTSAALAGGFVLSRRSAPLVASLSIASVLAGHGIAVTAADPMETLPQGEATFPVVMAEGNIDQNEKWTEAVRKRTVDTYVRLTREGVSKVGEDRNDRIRGIIIWPETAMPFDLASSRHTAFLVDLARSCGMPLVTGAPGIERDGRGGYRTYNRANLISASGIPAGSYDKEHLVPFGEYVPTLLDWDFLSGLLQEVGAYTPGTNPHPLRTAGLSMGMLICYEGIFPWLAQARVAAGANVLVDISNDGWFGRTPASRQHLYLTVLRAIEQDRWILRATNTGVSAVVDSHGRIVLSGGQFVEEVLCGRARTSTNTSPFHRAFPFIPPVCALSFALLLWRQNRKLPNHAPTE